MPTPTVKSELVSANLAKFSFDTYILLVPWRDWLWRCQTQAHPKRYMLWRSHVTYLQSNKSCEQQVSPIIFTLASRENSATLADSDKTWQNASTSKNKSTSALGRIGGITTIAGSGRYWGQRTTYTADTVPTPIWVRRCIQFWRLWTDFNGLTFVWDRLFCVRTRVFTTLICDMRQKSLFDIPTQQISAA